MDSPQDLNALFSQRWKVLLNLRGVNHACPRSRIEGLPGIFGPRRLQVSEHFGILRECGPGGGCRLSELNRLPSNTD